MDQKINYHILMQKEIQKITNKGLVPTLLLHSCCAPCSSYVLELLSEFFEITVFFYNPNISPEMEYEQRYFEQQRLINQMDFKHGVQLIKGNYENNVFLDLCRGFENCPEGSDRCSICYKLRLEKTAYTAKKLGFDYFTTTLTVSPYKNAQKLNEIGNSMSKKYGISYLFSDFKKNEGYKRSVELSKIYNLYRQNYCGCLFSKKL